MEKKYTVLGMHWGACEKRAVNALMKVPGVVSAKACAAENYAIVETNGEVSDAAVREALAGAKLQVPQD